jgi:hypothetical protein
VVQPLACAACSEVPFLNKNGVMRLLYELQRVSGEGCVNCPDCAGSGADACPLSGVSILPSGAGMSI